MKQTAVEYIYSIMFEKKGRISKEEFEQAKAMEKNNIDNKVIHFAEWLTNKHTTTLISLYEHFEEQYFNKTFKSE